MCKNLISIPRIESRTPQKDTIEWKIPQQVSVAFTLLDKVGYTVMVKVKVEKKHWWSQSWKTFAAHADNPDTAITKGREFLESYGYTIDPDTIQFEK